MQILYLSHCVVPENIQTSPKERNFFFLTPLEIPFKVGTLFSLNVLVLESSARDGDRVVWVRVLVRDIVLCSWARHLTLTVPLYTWVYKCVPGNLILGVTL